MGQYQGAETELGNQWIQQRLALYATQLNAISSGLSSRIYPDIAPPGVPYPFIVYQVQSPPRDIRGVGATRVMVDTLYVVKAVAEVASYGPLAPIASVIDTAMTSESGSAVGDGTVFSSVRENGLSLAEPPKDGTQIRNLGGVYRLHMQG